MTDQKAFPLSVSLYQNEKEIVQAVGAAYNMRTFSQALRLIIFEYAMSNGIKIEGGHVDENQLPLPKVS